MNVPLRSSETACCNSACVFMTIGPYQATGSWIGLPDTSRKRMPLSPACTVISSPASNSTSERSPTVLAHQDLLAVDLLLAEHADRLRCGAELAVAFEHIGKGVALELDLEGLALARRHEHVEIARIGGDAVDGALLAPEVAAHDAHARAVVVDDFRNLRRP